MNSFCSWLFYLSISLVLLLTCFVFLQFLTFLIVIIVFIFSYFPLKLFLNGIDWPMSSMAGQFCLSCMAWGLSSYN